MIAKRDQLQLPLNRKCKQKEMTKLNLGSGTSRVEGFLNVDLCMADNVDYVCDLNKDKLPFKDNSVDEIIAFSVLEHLYNLDNCLGECHRVLKEEGIIKIHIPYYNSSSAIRPDHLKFFNYNWHKYWTEDSNAIQSQLKPKFKLKSNKPLYGRLGRPLRFLGEKNLIKISKVFGEVIEGINTILEKEVRK